MLKVGEGDKDHMYLDRKGLVTTGIGHMLKTADAAAALPWHHKKTGLPATPAEVKKAFEKLRASWTESAQDHADGKNKFAARHYEAMSDLRLPHGFARQDALDRLQHEFLPSLRKVFPGFDSYPLPAQKAIVDMAYSLGVEKLKNTYPHFVAHCRAGNFADAASESVRKGGDPDRNAATAKLLEDAEQLKNSVRTFATEIRP
jgi:GH24 family phage-related lysozyme (muramidase)